MKTALTALLALASISFLAGCYSTLDGHVKAGVPFAKDTIEGRYERSIDQVWTAAKAALGDMGVLDSEDTINRTITAKVDRRSVYVKIDEIDTQLTRVRIQARTKGRGRDIDLASEIDKRIALRLARP